MIPVDVLRGRDLFPFYYKLICLEGDLGLLFRQATAAATSAEIMSALREQVVRSKLLKAFVFCLFKLKMNIC
jgi:hypothetical protein